jgi:hypothetical protein
MKAGQDTLTFLVEGRRSIGQNYQQAFRIPYTLPGLVVVRALAGIIIDVMRRRRQRRMAWAWGRGRPGGDQTR